MQNLKNKLFNKTASSTENIPLILIFFYYLSRPFILWIHEFGHAIPIVLFSKKAVTIYIGSHGDPTKSISFKIGLFEFFIKKNPFLWNRGVCIPQSNYIPIPHQITYILLGPVTALLSGIFLYSAAEFFSFPKYSYIFCVAFLICSIIDILYNLIPNKTPFQMYDGTLNYNDGQLIRNLWKYRKYSEAYNIGASAYMDKKYTEAASAFEKELLLHPKEKDIHHFVIASYLFSGNYTKAISLHEVFEHTFSLNTDDYIKAGFLYAQANQYNKAIYYFDEILKDDPEHTVALSNKAYTLNCMFYYSDAILLFEKVIELNPKDSYAYSNKGLSKFKSGFEEEGLADINYSISLDDSNSYSYRNLGIYHFDKKEFSKALDLFYKAQKLKPDTHLIEELIFQAKDSLRSE